MIFIITVTTIFKLMQFLISFKCMGLCLLFFLSVNLPFSNLDENENRFSEDVEMSASSINFM